MYSQSPVYVFSVLRILACVDINRMLLLFPCGKQTIVCSREKLSKQKKLSVVKIVRAIL